MMAMSMGTLFNMPGWDHYGLPTSINRRNTAWIMRRLAKEQGLWTIELREKFSASYQHFQTSDDDD